MFCYDYKCEKCGHIWENYQVSYDTKLNPSKCPNCGERKPTRLVGSPAVHVFYSPCHPRYRRGMVSEPKRKPKVV